MTQLIKTSLLLLIAVTMMNCKPNTGNNVYFGSELNDDFALNEISIDSAQSLLKSGKYSSREMVQLYLDRFAAIDQGGPALNSILEINPEAMQVADSLDRERADGLIRGPLHGIPILIKDNINTVGPMKTTAGSLALEGNVAESDAFVIAQLRKAGAIILGKTNLSEWANFRSTNSSSGWSSRGGQTRNAYRLNRTPCGSSSGSGVAVSANLCMAAIGTETDGSIMCPSGINGIVGIKPTVGLISRHGIIPISKTQDTAGPMARTVSDAALLLGAMTGVDSLDAVTLESKGRAYTDYSQFLNAKGLEGKRIGIDKTSLTIRGSVDTVFAQALNTLREQGAIIVELDFLKDIYALGDAEYEVLLYEFKDGLNHYLSTANAKVKSLEELIRFNKDKKEMMMPYFQQEILELAQTKGGLEEAAYLEALKKSTSARSYIDQLITTNQLDAFCGPTNAPAWTIDLVNGDHFVWGFSSAAAITGFPAITVPGGMAFELPVGITFFSNAYTEPTLISMAYAFEQATKHRVAPQFLTDL